jgi:hypothetical protein
MATISAHIAAATLRVAMRESVGISEKEKTHTQKTKKSHRFPLLRV